MPDLLVRLYDLPQDAPAAEVRRAFSAERDLICEFVRAKFSPAWAAECAGCFSAGRPTCFVAVHGEQLVGFACYDTTARGMFGPIGVVDAEQRAGLGRGLLLAALHDMNAAGYAYAIIGGAGAHSLAFYRSVVEVVEIPNSVPGFYKGILKANV